MDMRHVFAVFAGVISDPGTDQGTPLAPISRSSPNVIFLRVVCHRAGTLSLCPFLYFRCGTENGGSAFHGNTGCVKRGEQNQVSRNRYHARQAAVALLNMAKSTSDSTVAAALVELAAQLKEQAGDLPPPVTQRAPDVQPIKPVTMPQQPVPSADASGSSP
jgi:hypothetical protein